MRVFIGIDDTDNLESRGTGHRARTLGQLLDERGLVRLTGVTRHQLLVSPEIPYTSHNSSACLAAESTANDLQPLIAVSRDFLLSDSAEGSDVGLCVACADQVSEKVRDFGRRAKVEVLKMRDALDLAAAEGIYLEGLTGTHGGVIGSMAGVGLCSAGSDGRYLWLKGIREITGNLSVAQVKLQTGVEEVRTLSGHSLPDNEIVLLGEWNRPVPLAGKAVLYVEEEKDHGSNGWRLLDKQTIKRLSN
jgi:hypothetical protein